MQAPAITTALAHAQTDDRIAAAAARRHAGSPSGAAAPAHEVTIRLARPQDAFALARLAQLDGGHATLAGDVLVAESGNAIVAARAVRGGTALADPFRSTSALLDLLDVRAAQLSGDRRRAPTRRFARQARPVLRVGGAR